MNVIVSDNKTVCPVYVGQHDLYFTVILQDYSIVEHVSGFNA